MTDDATMFFIALVEQFPAVWDTNREDYCNKHLKEALWQKIATEMEAEWPAFGPYNAGQSWGQLATAALEIGHGSPGAAYGIPRGCFAVLPSVANSGHPNLSWRYTASPSRYVYNYGAHPPRARPKLQPLPHTAASCRPPSLRLPSNVLRFRRAQTIHESRVCSSRPRCRLLALSFV